MVQFRDEVVERSDLLLTDQESNDIGPDVVIKECRITLQLNAKRLTLLDVVRFIDCDITAKRQFRDYRWHSAFLEGCRFHGSFIGNDFGLRPDDYGPNGRIERCDFSDAILDACSFYGCDIATIILPKWPCFSLINPGDYFDQMASLGWPAQLGTWAESLYCYPGKNEVAVTYYAPRLMKRYKVSEEELVRAISRLANLRR